MIKNRKEIHKLLSKLNVSVGVELGVARGNYSKYLNDKHKFKEFYCIDRWSDHHDDKERNIVMEMFKSYKQVTILHSTFEDALTKFPDGYFDFIYIDGYAHTGQNEGKTIRNWYNKLKTGGLFAGHDYCNVRWPKTYVQVNEILGKEFGYKIHKTQEKTEPSWYIIKKR